jgi:hypothetical protein
MKLTGHLQIPTALSRGKKPRYPFDRKLGGPLQRLETLALDPIAVTIELQRDFSDLHIFNIYLHFTSILINFKLYIWGLAAKI